MLVCLIWGFHSYLSPSSTDSYSTFLPFLVIPVVSFVIFVRITFLCVCFFFHSLVILFSTKSYSFAFTMQLGFSAQVVSVVIFLNAWLSVTFTPFHSLSLSLSLSRIRSVQLSRALNALPLSSLLTSPTKLLFGAVQSIVLTWLL